MQALIIDDELKAREMLQFLVDHHIPEIERIDLASGADEANEILLNYNPDVVFLENLQQ